MQDSRQILNYLSSGGPLFDSARVLRSSNQHYISAIKWASSEYSSGLASSLADKVAALPEQLRAILAVSPSFRNRVDKVLSLCFARANQSAVSDAWREIDAVVRAISSCSKFPDDYQRLGEAGFQTSNRVTEPLPLIITAWKPPDSRSLYSEAADVEKMFHECMADTVGAELCVLRPISDAERQWFESALHDLAMIAPGACRDVVCNVRYVCWIDFARWKDMSAAEYREIGQSVSSHLVPSTCFFSYHAMKDRLLLRESLYHEALHKKLSNLLLDGTLLPKSYDGDEIAHFESYWNQDTDWNSNKWSFDRALYAFHVYVHLVVFYGVVLETRKSDLEQTFGRKQRGTAIERARALGDWLGTVAPRCMTPVGLGFLDSLNSSMEASIGTVQ